MSSIIITVIQVNAGPLAYARAFLDNSSAKKYPDNKVKQLKEVFRYCWTPKSSNNVKHFLLLTFCFRVQMWTTNQIWFKSCIPLWSGSNAQVKTCSAHNCPSDWFTNHTVYCLTFSLPSVLRHFVDACGQALVVNERLIKEDQQEYHDEMKASYRDLTRQLSSIMNEQVRCDDPDQLFSLYSRHNMVKKNKKGVYMKYKQMYMNL